jgi:hypothetical protein
MGHSFGLPYTTQPLYLEQVSHFHSIKNHSKYFDFLVKSKSVGTWIYFKTTGQRTRYNDQAMPVGLSEIWISNTSRLALGPTVSYSMGRDVLSRGVTPSRTEAKNQSSYTSTPAFLHDVDRENLLSFTSDTLSDAACVSQVRNVFRNIRMLLKFSFALPRHHNYSQLQDLRAWSRRPTNKSCKTL